MADTPSNEDQAAALATVLAPLVAEALKPQLDEREKSVNDRLDGIATKNSELLGKLHKSKESNTSLEEQMANLSKQISGDAKPTEIVLSKADARDVRKYKAARAQADEAGVPLRIDRDA